MQLIERVTHSLSPAVKQTWLLRAFGLTNIPLLLFCTPSVVEFNDRVCVVRIPLNWRTRNHLGSLYFGALAVGADCAGGIAASQYIRSTGEPVSFIFGDFKAEFLKRPQSDTLFRCEDGLSMRKLVDEAIETKERVHGTVHVVATSPKASGNEPVARFALTVSLKWKARAVPGAAA
jgi:acyl-coenzyme A thioesterase PaaI-like protein